MTSDATSTTPAVRSGRGLAALVGVLAAALGLAVAELLAAASDRLTSPIVSVGDRVIDNVPSGVKRWAIETFGTSDKAVLVAGIVIVVGALAAGAGVAVAAGHRWVGHALAGGLGLAGVLAATTGRNTSGWGAVTPIVAAAVADGVLGVLARATRPATGPGPAEAADTPAGAARPMGGTDRRSLMTTAITIGTATVATGGLAALLRRRGGAEADRAAVVVPGADDPLPAPPPDPALEPALGLDGLSTLYTPNSDFYRIDTALVVPSVTIGSWRLRVRGMVERELELTFDDLLALPQVEADVTLSCVSNEVGGGLVGSARWQGVRLDDLLAQAGILPDADQIVGRSVDGFTAGFPVATLDGRDALIAHTMNGEPLPTRHGFPARLVVPGLYGYVSATKWLSAIELTRFDRFQGYWVPLGWSALGPIKTQSRIDRPGGRIDGGPIAVAGVAWAPHRGIDRVELRVDDGTWQEATLGPSIGDDSWRQWWIEWEATPGEHRLSCRATDGTGETQPEERTPVAPDGATGWHTVLVDVME